ncbi:MULTISPECIES: ABC transporter substrate-binding protein [Azospira]|uniref:ABC-type branched-chain amino acid transport system, periplasmic component n=1 Tax=Azospira oryzae (strain ATCC BAA-33 / DSM 13638 / PS) TaxID=640081 RepID=G8QI86_AZOOP|nr:MULTISPECIES: ABC transporter substrate-binding protein [Azospira]AEV25246.1 ABC-type branched-chain amino acid transport system, periplasmic component [Azospira oryzae PS]MDK9691226.1 ABC transporter substrate-binding protein [Azospira sp.]BBN89377.1 branched-chain amino acid ABC transporter substrate-binding protein [Azospira sp. I09]
MQGSWSIPGARLGASLLGLSLLFAAPARADLNVGISVSATGPAASLGIPEKNSVALLPASIGGHKVNYIVLDDASDTTAAVKNARKLIAEHRVDVIVGSTTSPNSLAMIDAVAEGETPMLALAASSRIVEPMDEKRRWVFKLAQNDAHMATALVESMTSQQVRSVAYIGFADAYGEGWFNEFAKIAEARKLRLVANERFSRSDTSVTGQVLKVLAARPDAVLIGGAGTPAALPQKTLRERGYKGLIYQTHGVANSDFLRVGGKEVEGTLLPAGPVLVAAQLPADNPIRKVALDYVGRYEAVHGKGSVSTFGAHVWDAGLLLQHAVPLALKKAQPGSPEFRKALREALENTRDVVGCHGVYNMGPTDHLGFDQRARVMVRIDNGAWKLQP